MELVPVIGISVWLIVKGLVLFALFLYIIFALVVVRQVGLMVDTLEVGFEFPVKLISYLHFLFALGTFIVALAVL